MKEFIHLTGPAAPFIRGCAPYITGADSRADAPPRAVFSMGPAAPYRVLGDSIIITTNKGPCWGAGPLLSSAARFQKEITKQLILCPICLEDSLIITINYSLALQVDRI